MKVAITGATGFVGQRLVKRLTEANHSVVVLTRNGDRARRLFPAGLFPQCDVVPYTPLKSGDWQSAIDGCDGVVNLAGAPIAESRWTADRKREILDSRQAGTEKVVEAIAQASAPPKVLVNSSAIGYYGTSETATFDENSPAGNDFLAAVCKKWEAAAQAVRSDTRLVIIRTGIVLGQGGGALEKLLMPFRLFAGGPLGSGRQWFSWIHLDDMVSLIIQALTDEQFKGVYNGTAPKPVRMTEFCNVVGQVMGRPSWLPVPSFALEALLGDAAAVVLEGQEVIPKRTLETGFSYEYSNAKNALTQLLD
ncbi:MAG: TIGR01777 family oxidoreductase [Cyanophyceae cyanobacterium]